MERATVLTKYLKKYDRELYCTKNAEGKLLIYRNSKRCETYYLGSDVLTVVRSSPHFIMALTHNWQFTGKPVDWGSLPLLRRIKEMDNQNRDLVEEQIKQWEKSKEEKERLGKNQNEAFLYDFHSKFKKTFNDINVSNLSKTPKRKDDRCLS